MCSIFQNTVLLTYQYTVPPAVMDFFLVTPSLLLKNKLSPNNVMIGRKGVFAKAYKFDFLALFRAT